MNHKQAVLVVASVISVQMALAESPPIDRQALVRRHNVELNQVNGKQWLQVGNGEIAFGIGVDGLQTFAGLTMSHWGWHTAPLPEGMRPEDLKPIEYQVDGRTVRYHTSWLKEDPLWNWLRQNPHRMNLGQVMLLRDGKRVIASHVTDIQQALDLWSGVISSRYTLDGQPVMVETCAHPTRDILAVRFESPLVESNRLSALFVFPYADPGGSGGTTSKPELHTTTLNAAGENAVVFDRRLHNDWYRVAVGWNGKADVSQQQAHYYELKPQSGVFELVVSYSPEAGTEQLPTFAEVKAASVKHWPAFWQAGGAIDLSESKDPRWRELERRIVLSQYLLAVNEAGSLPPQEAGLVNNGWHGKFHLEMHWWHGTHYALWDRWELFDRSLGWYREMLPSARELAAFNGYQGARWPKMVGPEGRDSPSKTGPILIWQQPHPIFYAEQDYRLHPTPETLAKWRDVVFATADFLASYPVLNPASGHYEFVKPYETMPEDSNPPSFELGYWRYGLRTALEWRERLGLDPEPKWQDVLAKLAPLPVQDGVYWYRALVSHPGHIGTYGMLPGDGVDPEIMAATVRKLMAEYQADTGWGWDFPMIAMAAARTGQPDLAIDALMHPSYKNAYSVVGNNQGSGTAYFPGNGGILYAVALMAAGWDGSPDRHAPGFPDDGSWVVKWEGLKKAQ